MLSAPLNATAHGACATQVNAVLTAALEADGGDAAGGLEEGLAMADAHGVRSAVVGQARVRLKAIQEEQIRFEAELSRATAALEAARGMRDVQLLKDTLAAAVKATVDGGLIGRAEERLATLQEEERVRLEAEVKAKAEAEAKAKRRAAAAEQLRTVTDAAEDEGAIAAALEAADVEGVDGHALWMAQQVRAIRATHTQSSQRCSQCACPCTAHR